MLFSHILCTLFNNNKIEDEKNTKNFVHIVPILAGQICWWEKNFFFCIFTHSLALFRSLCICVCDTCVLALPIKRLNRNDDGGGGGSSSSNEKRSQREIVYIYLHIFSSSALYSVSHAPQPSDILCIYASFIHS